MHYKDILGMNQFLPMFLFILINKCWKTTKSLRFIILIKIYAMQDIMLYIYKIQIFLLLKANHISFSFKIMDKKLYFGTFHRCAITATIRIWLQMFFDCNPSSHPHELKCMLWIQKPAYKRIRVIGGYF